MKVLRDKLGLLVGGVGLVLLMILFPDRILLAILLFISLILLLNRITQVTPDRQKHGTEMPRVSYETAKSNWKNEMLGRQSGRRLRQRRSKPFKARKSNIIRLVDEGEMAHQSYQEAKLRWRNEINDQAIERRIQSVFERIRSSDDDAYQKGLKEISNLLKLRQNSLMKSLKRIQ